MPKKKKISCANPDCDEKFIPTRASQKYHSPACRVAAARAAGADPETGEVLVDIRPKTDRTAEAIAHSQQGQGIVHQAGGAGAEAEFNHATAEKPYDRDAALQRFIEMGVAKVNWLSTGIVDLDALTKIPRGRITQIQGRYGVGKTTLCLNMIKGMQGVRTLYIDAEAALNPHLLVDLEIDPDNFTLYNESNYIEDIFEIVKKAAKSGDYDLIVLDSVPMTTSKSIEDSDPTARNIGQKAFIYHKLCETIAMDLKRTDTAMVFINQVRDVIGSYTPQTYTPGGTGIPYQASLIVQLKTIPSWRFPDKPKDKVYLGHIVEATIIKSKVNQPHRTNKFKLFYPNPHVETDQEF
jgi:recombination protein RecA